MPPAFLDSNQARKVELTEIEDEYAQAGDMVTSRGIALSDPVPDIGLSERDVIAVVPGEGPIVAAAIHDGHYVRPEVERLLALTERERLYEEDPFTARWVGAGGSSIVALRSRFEFDANRAREAAVYVTPEDAWGLELWRRPPSEQLVARSHAGYDRFYALTEKLLRDVEARHGRFVVLDIHSYNHRRTGPKEPPASPVEHPEVNLGTGSMPRARWARVVDRFVEALRAHDFQGRSLDVRENVKFRGGYFPRWVHETFPETGCALALELKKTFMDEWTGVPDESHIDSIGRALEEAVSAVREVLPGQ